MTQSPTVPTAPAAQPVVRAGLLTFELDSSQGTFHLSSAHTGVRIASNVECGVEVEGRFVGSRGSQVVWRRLDESDGHGLEVQFRLEHDIHLRLVAAREEVSGGLLLTLHVSNEGPARVLGSMVLLRTGEAGTVGFCEEFEKLVFLKSGWQGWDSAGALRPAHVVGELPEQISHHFAAIADAGSGEGLLLGFSDAARHFSNFRVASRSGVTDLTVTAEFVPASLEKGESRTSESLWLGYDAQPSLLFVNYGHWRHRARTSHVLPVVWDSWFVKHEETSEKDILEALDSIEKHLPQVNTVIIGDGYQMMHQDGPGIGDWLETNPRYPHGLGWLADRIRRHGFRPGIWTAPFLVGERSQFYRYYPDAILRSAHPDEPHWREMWRGDRVFYLDTTHPDARHFIRDIFENLSYRMGFEVFQVDFAYAAAAEGFRRDTHATPAEALDRGLEMIRRTVGEDRTLILSGAPIGVGAATIDALRVTPDAAPGWQGPCGALAMIQALMVRAFLGDRLPSVAAGPIVPTGGLSDDEFRSVVTAVGLSGGPVTISGALAGIPSGRADMLKKITPVYPRPAVPLDALRRTVPQLFGLPLHNTPGGAWVVGVFNTTDEVADRQLDFSLLGWTGGSYHVYEFWEHQYLGVQRGSVTLERLAPHSCRLLAIHPDLGYPQLLSTDEHVTQGAASIRRWHWQPGEGSQHGWLHVELAHAGTTGMHVHCAVPQGMLARDVRAHNGRARVNRQKSNNRLLSIDTAFRDYCSFDIHF